MGSPPRMRGKLGGERFQTPVPRITPADAGKTPPKFTSIILTTDHPRGCGENVTAYDPTMSGTGSPPRMRGKPQMPRTRNADARITPADAGKTAACPLSGAHGRDHPRGCGENHHPPVRHHRRGGSPPRMRGKHTAGLWIKNSNRITPADAGKTLQVSFSCFTSRDHPRGCGENLTTV